MKRFDLYLDNQLEMDRCSHCSVSKPNIVLKTNFETESYDKQHNRIWGIYVCKNCGQTFAKWAGKCNVCGEWNCLEEQVESPKIFFTV